MQVLVKEVIGTKDGKVTFLGVIEQGALDGQQISFDVALEHGAQMLQDALAGTGPDGDRIDGVYVELHD